MIIILIILACLCGLSVGILFYYRCINKILVQLLDNDDDIIAPQKLVQKTYKNVTLLFALLEDDRSNNLQQIVDISKYETNNVIACIMIAPKRIIQELLGGDLGSLPEVAIKCDVYQLKDGFFTWKI